MRVTEFRMNRSMSTSICWPSYGAIRTVVITNRPSFNPDAYAGAWTSVLRHKKIEFTTECIWPSHAVTVRSGIQYKSPALNLLLVIPHVAAKITQLVLYFGNWARKLHRIYRWLRDKTVDITCDRYFDPKYLFRCSDSVVHVGGTEFSHRPLNKRVLCL